MSAVEAPASGTAWQDACLAARLVAAAPSRLGGIWLRAPSGPVRDRWLDLLRAALAPGGPIVRIPLHATDERLLGGLDLAATLGAGRPVAERGLLASADGGVILLPLAERCTRETAAHIGAALDLGEARSERDGLALCHPARFAVVALDEGRAEDERPPPSLTDRLAIHLDLAGVAPRDAARPYVEASTSAPRPDVTIGDDGMTALCAAALAFGIGSPRAPLFAMEVARASAVHAGRAEIGPDDLALAARLVLAPRATRLPAEASEEETSPDRLEEPHDGVTEGEAEGEAGPIDDLVLAAVKASIPAGLLADLRLGPAGRRARSRSAGAGATRRDHRHGRPAGTVKGVPGGGARLSLVETMRAAAPWQRLRARTGGRIVVRRDDLRIRRHKRRSEATTLFVVDASGSSAFHRLAEAKGAVELLLAECYVRRDKVALMTFRGTAADLILPPTRSLTRAKRGLAALPGGGGTPLAAAIDAAGAAAAAVGRGGGSVLLVFLTDGRANIARDGRAGREQADADARAAARALRAGGAAALFIDTSPKPHQAAREIAREMGARYLPLPSAEAHAVSDLVSREIAAARSAG